MGVLFVVCALENVTIVNRNPQIGAVCLYIAAECVRPWPRSPSCGVAENLVGINEAGIHPTFIKCRTGLHPCRGAKRGRAVAARQRNRDPIVYRAYRNAGKNASLDHVCAVWFPYLLILSVWSTD